MTSCDWFPLFSRKGGCIVKDYGKRPSNPSQRPNPSQILGVTPPTKEMHMEIQPPTDKPTKRDLAIDAAIVGRALKDRIDKLALGEARDLARSLVADMPVEKKRQLIWRLDEVIKARKRGKKPTAAKPKGGPRLIKPAAEHLPYGRGVSSVSARATRLPGGVCGTKP